MYTEIGIDFQSILTGDLAKLISDRILKSFIEDGKLLSNYKEYSLSTILATKQDSLVLISKTLRNPIEITNDYIICKPSKSRSKDFKYIEYTYYLPYHDIIDNENPLAKLLDCMKKAISRILQDLEYTQENIDKIVNSIKE